IMAALQNGTAFFASTSLLAIGGALTLLRSTGEVLAVMTDMPLGLQTTRALWEAKSLGLVVIFVYAFFKFAWSYRLFNYVAILLGGCRTDRIRLNPKRKPTCCGPRVCSKPPDAISIAVSTRSSSRSDISAGSLARWC